MSSLSFATSLARLGGGLETVSSPSENEGVSATAASATSSEVEVIVMVTVVVAATAQAARDRITNSRRDTSLLFIGGTPRAWIDKASSRRPSGSNDDGDDVVGKEPMSWWSSRRNRPRDRNDVVVGDSGGNGNVNGADGGDGRGVNEQTGFRYAKNGNAAHERMHLLVLDAFIVEDVIVL